MENSIYVALSRQVALRNKMDIIANNIANMNTPGFRAQNMVFSEYIEEATNKPKTDPKDPLSMVLDYGHYQNTAPGPMQKTDNPLDLALVGPGYLGVQTNEGVMYTRAGNLQMNVNGELVTGAGYLVASADGGPITIPENTTKIRITEDGFIANEEGELGQLLISEFTNVQNLEAMGNGLYKSDAEGEPSQNTKVIQGMVEGANVTPVLEMTRMIDTLRSYQNTQKILDNEHERQRAMIRQMTRSN
jgi:flagellar basal-body rod protein FlgF